MPRFRIFQNDVPTINASDLIRNKKNKEIYSGVKNAVDNNQMTSEGYTFDSGGCLRSAPSYDAFLVLTRGWSLGSIRYEDISNISTSNASDFADPGAPWAQRYNTINLTNYDIVRDASLNSVHNTGGKYAINVIHRDISSLEMNNLLTGSTINPNAKYSALNPAYSASIQLDPSNILYSTGCSAKSINNNDDAKWKQLVSTQQSSEQYRNNIYRIVKNTDWQFSYPRKFNIKQSRISNNIIPNSTPDSFNAIGGVENTYTNNGYTYRSHTFLYNSNDNTDGQTTYTFITTGAAKSVDFLIVAGGGGGTSKIGGGGGAGGMVVGISQTLPIGSYPVVVGSGGAGATTINGGNRQGYDGLGSSFYNFDASGGGGGGNNKHPHSNDGAAFDLPWINWGRARGGGSGGGARGANGSINYAPTQQPTYSGTTNVTGYGNRGGAVINTNGAGAGGGGAGDAGEDNDIANAGSDGGNGLQNNFRTGSDIYYAGGGGSGAYNNPTAGTGGQGGGGNGSGGDGGDSNNAAGTAGQSETGGGGGGGYADLGVYNKGGGGGDGGSGIVVIRYVV